MKQKIFDKFNPAKYNAFSCVLLIVFLFTLTSCSTTTNIGHGANTPVNFGADTLKCTNEDRTITAEVISVRTGRNCIVIELLVSNNTEGRILKLRTAEKFWYDYTPEPGILSTSSYTIPKGLHLSDNFGNTFKLENIKPRLAEYGEVKDLRPGKSQKITARFEGQPLENSLFLELYLDFLYPYLKGTRTAGSFGINYERLRIPLN